MPLITTQSAKGYGWGKYNVAPALGFEKIASYTVSGTAGTISFSGIPQTYKHLQIRGQGQASYGGSGGGSAWFMVVNSDAFPSGTSWNIFSLNANNTTAYSGKTFNTYALTGIAQWAGNGTFAPAIIDIFDYTSTSKYKTAKMVNGIALNSNGGNNYTQFTTGAWKSLSPITDLTLYHNAGGLSDGLWNNGTTFDLYGIG